jgi:hypothetical protein
MLATRKQHDVESIRQKVLTSLLCAEDMPYGSSIYPLYPIQLNCGLSVRGHLVSIDPIGSIQLSALMERVGPEKLFEFMIGVSELRQIIMDEMSVETGMLVQSVQIKDLHGLGLGAFRDARAISTLQEIISICTSMYPESLSTLYIVNAPFFFPMVRLPRCALPRCVVCAVVPRGRTHPPSSRGHTRAASRGGGGLVEGAGVCEGGAGGRVSTGHAERCAQRAHSPARTPPSLHPPAPPSSPPQTLSATCPGVERGEHFCL